MKAEHFSPRIYGVLIREGKVLLTRSVFHTRHFVNFPGGGIEIGEAPMDALRREFREETGLTIEPVRVLFASEGLHESTQMPIQIVSMYWLVQETGGKLMEGGNGDDVIALFWTDLSRIPTEEMFPSDLEFTRKLPGILVNANVARSS